MWNECLEASRGVEGKSSVSYSIGNHSQKELSYKNSETQDYYKNPILYSYDFLTSQKPLQILELPKLTSLFKENTYNVNSDLTVQNGLNNAKEIGKIQGKDVFVKNAYTERLYKITSTAIRHGLGGKRNRIYTNARIGSRIGEAVTYAIPINALYNNEGSNADGTYAMAGLSRGAKNDYYVYIVTVEQYNNNVLGLEVYDVTHAINGRKIKQINGNIPADTRSQGLNLSTNASATITITDFLDIVKTTHQSILSEDVLNHYNEERHKNGHYSDKVKFSVKEGLDSDPVNTSMTMDDAKQMIQRAFVLGSIGEWYDGEYKNGDDWIRGEGIDEVALHIENEWTLQEKYLNKISAYLDGDVYVEDILQAYLDGTLTGNDNAATTKRLDVSKDIRVNDSRFYSPQRIDNAQRLLEIAEQKATGKNKDSVYAARAKLILFAHNEGAAELLGLTHTELNQKLRNWGGYSKKSLDLSNKINDNVSFANRWSGIENCANLVKYTASKQELAGLVKSVTGASSPYERNYITRTMLALDTHIDWSWLNIEFVDHREVNAGNPRNNTYGTFRDDTVSVSHRAGAGTVAHEMGHALDYKWGRDLGFRYSPLTEVNSSTEAITDPQTRQFFDNFKVFLDSISDSADIRSSYTQDFREVFARFVAKFVEWTDRSAGNRFYQESSWYNDKFTEGQFIEFAHLLQEKSLLDNMKQEQDADTGAKYSAKEGLNSKYTYEYFAGKPDMEITLIDDKNDYSPGKETRDSVVKDALLSALRVGRKDKSGNVFVYVEDADAEILVSKKGLRHSLDRRLSVVAPVTENIGPILKNAIRINELTPQLDTVEKSYALIGIAKNGNNEPYVVSFVVNRASNEIMSIDVLYAVNAKKEATALIEPELSSQSDVSLTASVISITDLLDYVNSYYPDILPEDVLKHYGYESRPEGRIGESALYSRKENAVDVGKVLDENEELQEATQGKAP